MAERMLVIPAIDLRGGRCVRLLRGDFARETVYDDDPVRVAKHWRELGAPWIHVVDLDGARGGRPEQLDLVERMAQTGARIELGGGLRTLDDIGTALGSGAARVIVGTAATEDEHLLGDAVDRFGADAIVLGVDARNGRVAVRGWTEESGISAHDVIERAKKSGVQRVIYTDIERDGTLTSPNYGAISEVVALGVRVIASGGVSSTLDLKRLASIPGVEGAIVGKALYEGAVRIDNASEWWVSPVDEG